MLVTLTLTLTLTFTRTRAPALMRRTATLAHLATRAVTPLIFPPTPIHTLPSSTLALAQATTVAAASVNKTMFVAQMAFYNRVSDPAIGGRHPHPPPQPHPLPTPILIPTPTPTPTQAPT